MRDLPKLSLDLKNPEGFGNVAEKLNDDDRRTIATDLIELVNMDLGSMSEWLGEAEGYLETTEGGNKDAIPSNTEQRGTGEGPPPATEMTLAAVIQFSARASDALLGDPDLVRASEPGGEELAAWLSRQLRSVDPNWILDTDPLVVHMAVTGLAWRKRAFDEYDRSFHSNFLTCREVIVNNNVRSIERAPRITQDFQRYPYEIERSIRRKHWIDYEPRFDDADPQAPKKFFEMDAWLDFDGDETEEPWTVTIACDDSPEIVKIRPRWSKKTIVDTTEVLFFKPIRRFYPYRFLPNPNGGFFPMGFGKLLERTEGSADRMLAAITNTAENAAENGGVYAGGDTGLPASPIELANNRLTAIPTGGRPLGEMFQAFPQKDVTPGSVQVLEKIITLGDRIAGTLNLLENAPASMTATLAKGLIDTGTQVQSAVHRRIVTSLTQETHMFAQMADAYDMLPATLSASGITSIAVTADPQLATEMHRSAAGNLYVEMMQMTAAGVPWNMPELQQRFCQVMRLPQPEKLIGQAQPPQLTPAEKLKGVTELQKAKNDRVKVLGGLAVQITQAIKNMVDANGGMVDTRTALLQSMQLEMVLQNMMQEAASNDGSDGMAQPTGNPDAGSVSATPPSPDSGDVSGGQPGATAGPGAGVGLQ